MNATVKAQEALPQPAATATAVATDEKKPAPLTRGIWQGSVLFSPDTALRLREAMEAYRNGGGETADYLSELLGNDAAEQKPVQRAPYFYLGSIIYPSNGEWFLWLNGKKITAMKPPESDRLTVEAITPRRVTFRWKPEALEETRSNWKRRKEIDGFTGKSSAGVEFDEEVGIVTFTLSPNQTFFAQNMQVVEGRLAPSKQLPKGFVPSTPIGSTTDNGKALPSAEAKTQPSDIVPVTENAAPDAIPTAPENPSSLKTPVTSAP